MKQAIIYCRFSPRPDAKESKSNEKQIERCSLYCDKQNYHVHSILCDTAISGKTINRPRLNDAISELKPGMVLVVDTADRLARDMLVALTIQHEVEQRGGTIEYADGSPSRATPEGRLFGNILSAFAQYDRERFARRTKAGLAKKRANGQWLGKPPIGYKLDRVTKQLIKDANEQEVLDVIMRQHNSNIPSGVITDFLDSCYGLCRGKPWNARTVRRIIKREIQKST